MEILERLVRHWAGLAMEGKLQWSVVRRRWFGMLAVQQWGCEEFGSGESLWDSEAFRRTWLETEKYWQHILDFKWAWGLGKDGRGIARSMGAVGRKRTVSGKYSREGVWRAW